jgi:hypothetical protein
LLIVSFLGSETVAEPPANFHEANAGTAENPYQIATLANLRWLSETPEVWGSGHFEGGVYIFDSRYYFSQTADIDAYETREWNNSGGFSPIGTFYHDGNHISENMFTGVYDGNGYIINSLFIDVSEQIPGYQYFGLFGNIHSSQILNVNLNIIITNYVSGFMIGSVVGTIVGYANQSTVKNCSASGELQFNLFNTANKAFKLDKTTNEQDSYSTIDLNLAPPPDPYIGGLVGVAIQTEIGCCYSTVTIDDNPSCIIGGLIGYLGSSTLKNSFFRGEVVSLLESTYYIGGIAGVVNSSNVNNVYVSSSNGINNSRYLVSTMRNSTLQNSLWDNETTGITYQFYSAQNTNINNVLGLSSEEMKQETTYTSRGWDFENIWSIVPNFNDGYPYLRNIPTPTLKDEDASNAIKPERYHTVYPNPISSGNANIKTNILGKNVKINIYNIKGQLIKKLDSGSITEKESIFFWNKRDNNNQEVPSGIYMYRIVSDNEVLAGKFLIIK